MARLVAVLFLFACCSAPGFAGAQAVGGGSFLDLDDDGVFGPRDVPLSTVVGPGADGFFNAWVADTGYQPSGRPVGLVIEGTLVLGSTEIVEIVVNGHVRVRGNILVTRSELEARITTVGGDVDVAPGIAVNGRSDVLFRTMQGGDIRVGDGCRFATRGEFASIGFDADGTLTVGADTRFQLRGGGYNTVLLHGRDGVTIAPGLDVRAPSHGGLLLLSGGDLALTGVTAKAGYIHIEAYSNDRHPEAKRIAIAASSLRQSYRNGDFRIIAGADQRTLTYAPHAVVLSATTITTKTGDAMIVPEPEIR